MMFGYGSNWAFWEVALMWVGMIAFWSLLIWAVYSLIASASRKPDHEHHVHDDNQARRILDQRLAKGEIDSEEYRRVCDLIAHDDRTPVMAGDRR